MRVSVGMRVRLCISVSVHSYTLPNSWSLPNSVCPTRPSIHIPRTAFLLLGTAFLLLGMNLSLATCMIWCMSGEWDTCGIVNGMVDGIVGGMVISA